jgi:hypothetical protein
MRTIILTVAMTLSVSQAFAQTTDCKKIQDSLDRLRCYDVQAAPPAPAAKPATPAPPATTKETPPAAAKEAPAKDAPAAAKESPAKAATATSGEDPMIAAAKASIKAQLRDPDSARFRSVKIRTVKGKPGVCGMVLAKNRAGFMTGMQPFAYDGEKSYLVIFNPGPANITNLGTKALGEDMADRIDNFDRLCK